MELSTRLRDVIGADAAKLEKQRGLRTLGDFLAFTPRKYLDPARTTSFAGLAGGEFVSVIATVQQATTRPMRQRRGSMLQVVIADDAGGTLDLTFFKPYGHEDRLVPGVRGLFSGEVGSYRGRPQLTHPSYQLVGDRADVETDQPVPVYTAVKGVTDAMLTACARLVLGALEQADVPDAVPAEIREREHLPGLVECYRMLHLPRYVAGEREQRAAATSEPAPPVQVLRARRRLKVEEALVIQTVLAQRRAAQAGLASVPREPRPDGILAAFDARLPFELTEGQREVGEEIAAGLRESRPMNRLLQGEVGSGKTLVALRAMLTVVDAGGQAALLAPTEVLAAQHHRTITSMLGDLAEGGQLGGHEYATRVALLTGSLPAAERKRALLDAASGEAGIVVGTHALLGEKVQFADLALVVVDEQHRFGVEQRDALRDKGAGVPHTLVMTATPIPRTVAMTVYGDMDTSVLRQLPRGRSPIQTVIVQAANARWVARAWERVAEEVAAGHQAYVLCARIGDDGEDAVEPEDRPVAGVDETVERLRAAPALAGLRIEALHGRLAAEEKDRVMAAFSRGEVDVLVATTIVEVGVDVPNATVMVIQDADRFGVSQLHQLRGRVGRGSAPGLCLLLTGAEEATTTLERLRAVESSTDGFELSRVDLEQRREGDVLGARQSGGISSLRHLRLSHREDEGIIRQAREDAARIVAQDPGLEAHPALREAVATRLTREQADFLERG